VNFTTLINQIKILQKKTHMLLWRSMTNFK